MSDTAPNLPVRAAAEAILAVEDGRASLPPAVLTKMREAVANAAPNCTPAQIANGECPGV